MIDLFNALALGLLALLPLINPPTTVAVFLAFSAQLSREEKNKQAFLTALYVFIIMTITYYLGEIIMGVFSISIPGLRMAGGGILMIIGLKMLFPQPHPPVASGTSKEESTNFAFIPLAMPMTAGPGTIAMIISSAATIKTNTVFPSWVLLIAPPLIFIITGLILWGCLRSADFIVKKTGKSGIDAISRLMGFLLICMGVQFAINGSVEIVQGIINTNAHLLRSP
ncbi:MarC family NAAT transporter [Pseudomonas sp. NA-150]|uniref:MarC family NAAT transporter n=1 Tax=Pseudomonas sp. NA-150 TaxID=3367525 RepID=UPI0037C8A2D4